MNSRCQDFKMDHGCVVGVHVDGLDVRCGYIRLH